MRESSRHTTDLQTGEVYIFRGLSGRERATVPEHEKLAIYITGVTATGQLQFVMVPPNSRPNLQTTDVQYIPYSEALLMVEQGIWVEPDTHRLLPTPSIPLRDPEGH